jgi:hypothetical protein
MLWFGVRSRRLKVRQVSVRLRKHENEVQVADENVKRLRGDILLVRHVFVSPRSIHFMPVTARAHPESFLGTRQRLGAVLIGRGLVCTATPAAGSAV